MQARCAFITRVQFRLFMATLFLTAVGMTGCGGEPAKPTGSVSGKVVLDGTPLTEGTVQFYAEGSGGGGVAPIQADGSFQMAEPIPLGTYKILVLPPPQPDPQMGVAYEPKTYPNFPQKYRSETTTTLTGEVKEGDNTFNLEMKP